MSYNRRTKRRNILWNSIRVIIGPPKKYKFQTHLCKSCYCNPGRFYWHSSFLNRRRLVEHKSDENLTPTTDTNFLLAIPRGGSHYSI